MRRPGIFGLAVVGILGVVSLTVVPIKQVAYTEMERYQDTETYYEKVNQALSYVVVNSGSQGGFDLARGVFAEAFVGIRNTDIAPGTFDVAFTFRALRRTFSDSARLYIVPGEAKTAHGVADIDLGEDWTSSYTVIPGTKTVDVARQRTVWRERPVVRYKKVPLLSFR